MTEKLSPQASDFLESKGYQDYYYRIEGTGKNGKITKKDAELFVSLNKIEDLVEAENDDFPARENDEEGDALPETRVNDEIEDFSIPSGRVLLRFKENSKTYEKDSIYDGRNFNEWRERGYIS